MPNGLSDFDFLTEQERYRRLKRENGYDGPREQPAGLDPVGQGANAGARLARDIFDSSQARGYSPEIGNILAESQVLGLSPEMQGPNVDGTAGYRQQINPLPNRPDKGPLVPDFKHPDWSPEQQLASATHSQYASVGMDAEAKLNQMRMRLGVGGAAQTQRDRLAAGQAVTEEDSRAYNDTLEGYAQQGVQHNRDIEKLREQYAGMAGVAEVSQPSVPTMQERVLGDGTRAVGYGNTLQVIPKTLPADEVEMIGGRPYVRNGQGGLVPVAERGPSDMETLLSRQDAEKVLAIEAELAGLEGDTSKRAGKKRQELTAQLDRLAQLSSLSSRGGGGISGTGGVAASRDVAKPGQAYRAPDGSIRTKGN